jgi:uncharacterized repeat protein (TIGR01451 family)
VELLNTITNQVAVLRKQRVVHLQPDERQQRNANGWWRVAPLHERGRAGPICHQAVSFVTPVGKLPTDPATVGDVLEYSITIPNSGNSTAFDTSVVDTLPANVRWFPIPPPRRSTASMLLVLS